MYQITMKSCVVLRTGPLINTWCMRMEGKNAIVKQYGRTSNFKNVPYSIAKRHQRLLCAYLNSGTFFDTQLECGPGKLIKCPHPRFEHVLVIIVSWRTKRAHL